MLEDREECFEANILQKILLGNKRLNYYWTHVPGLSVIDNVDDNIIVVRILMMRTRKRKLET